MFSRRFLTLLSRSLRLRCPLCGEGKLFAGWFRMHTECAHCHTVFEREPGFFLGSIYISYGITAVLSIIFYFVIWGNNYWEERRTMSLVSTGKLLPAAFAIIFPIFIFRHARALWLGFDQYHDPRPGEVGTQSNERPRGH